ncbi:oxidoreductase [Leifsonia sp. Root4]|uniref:Gfo/Idh/MocA family protein n=1 Tax=Leifsonia sp. Root4 TaxID=1736525 RepID=UPI0006F20BF2|nr:Gfo/Idh/MocA family oxidoreductase [Leifsonia sp. Root4]KQW08174.1 oxidoreductase [Leifsonia sp. Root4]
MGNSHRVGIVGLGNISAVYLETLSQSRTVSITAVADLDEARAKAVAEQIPGARALTVEDLVTSSEVDTVLNLTIPSAHAQIALAAIRAGKHTYGEKPLAASMSDARAIVEAGIAAGVRVGCAPDTVLGTGVQTARAFVDSGGIGRPLAASATMVAPGHERWHPNPDFFYLPGGGPLLDMGPYYVSALVQLLGPVRSVVGASSRLRAERVINNGGRAGEAIPVKVQTHISGVLEHENGALSTLTTSFDGAATNAANIEVHGELGTLALPDPNWFDGEVRFIETGGTEWRALDVAAGYQEGARGAGLLDFIEATPERPARASGTLALHVLEIMTALLQSAEQGQRIALATTAERGPAVPLTARSEWLK